MICKPINPFHCHLPWNISSIFNPPPSHPKWLLVCPQNNLFILQYIHYHNSFFQKPDGPHHTKTGKALVVIIWKERGAPMHGHTHAFFLYNMRCQDLDPRASPFMVLSEKKKDCFLRCSQPQVMHHASCELKLHAQIPVCVFFFIRFMTITPTF